MSGDYGIKVSKPGEDVKTKPTTYKQIQKFSLISSVDVPGAGFTLLKVKISGKVPLANGATSTIPHGLPYTPIIWCFMRNGSSQLVPVYDNFTGTSMYVNATNVIITNNDGATRDFFLYIFYDAI